MVLAIGSAAVQLAKSYGAEVTAVVATRHLELVKSLGADRAIDYTAEDFTRIGERFDFVFDAVGKASFFRCRRLLKPKGTFMSTDIGPWGQNLPLMLCRGSRSQQGRRSAATARERPLIVTPQRPHEVGQFRAVIDRIVSARRDADAYRYVGWEGCLVDRRFAD
jgi:NADPH:quinone reductase-like Zn-dependent oxidoreductase